VVCLGTGADGNRRTVPTANLDGDGVLLSVDLDGRRNVLDGARGGRALDSNTVDAEDGDEVGVALHVVEARTAAHVKNIARLQVRLLLNSDKDLRIGDKRAADDGKVARADEENLVELELVTDLNAADAVRHHKIALRDLELLAVDVDHGKELRVRDDDGRAQRVVELGHRVLVDHRRRVGRGVNLDRDNGRRNRRHNTLFGHDLALARLNDTPRAGVAED